MPDAPQSINIDVRLQMQDGALSATWFFTHEEGGRDATQVRLYSGQEYLVTYQLVDPAAWSLDAASLRRVTSDTSTGFLTLGTGQTTPSHTLQEGAGTVSVKTFSAETLTLSITNTQAPTNAPWTLGLSLTVSSRNTQGRGKQSSQDPQMVLEPVTVPPPPSGH